MGKLYFMASDSAVREITDLFDFAWPTAVAMWNLRWQVSGYVTVRPVADDAELKARFAAGSGIERLDLARACIDTPWDAQQRRFAELLLVNLVAIYEGWLSVVLPGLCPVGRIDTYSKKLQYAGKVTNGVAELTSAESLVTKPALYSHLRSHPKNSLAKIDPLLRCYRYYKECRNCIMHNGGRANSTAVTAATAYEPFCRPNQLGVKEAPSHQTLAVGDAILVDLRSAAGFGDIVLRLTATLDAGLSRSVGAETEIDRRWQKFIGRRVHPLPHEATRRSGRIRSLMAELGLPRPTSTTEMENYLRDRRLVN